MCMCACVCGALEFQDECGAGSTHPLVPKRAAHGSMQSRTYVSLAENATLNLDFLQYTVSPMRDFKAKVNVWAWRCCGRVRCLSTSEALVFRSLFSWFRFLLHTWECILIGRSLGGPPYLRNTQIDPMQQKIQFVGSYIYLHIL